MREHRRAQAGNILLPLTMIGLICSIVLGTLMSHAVYLEQAAVENRLAEIRAYWAVMGHFRYAISRMRRVGLCPNALGCLLGDTVKDDEKVTVLQGYLNEIASYQTWTYPEENAGYFIKVGVTAAADPTLGRNQFSGHLMMTNTYPTAGVSTLPVLSGLAARFTPFQIRFCTSLTAAYANCGPINQNNNGGKTTGLYAIKRFYRLPSAS